MAARIRLVGADGSVLKQPVALGEVLAPQGDMGLGEERWIGVENIGDTLLRQIAVSVSSPGQDHIALAADDDGKPAVWADIGGAVNVADVIGPGDVAGFWAKAVFAAEDVEQRLSFEFLVDAVSVGA